MGGGGGGAVVSAIEKLGLILEHYNCCKYGW